jgi:hypothetical protein
MLGYTKREFVGQNIVCIIPEPLASLHQGFVNRYARTGCEFMMQAPRIQFVKHRQGFVFPVGMKISPAEDGFVAVLQKLPMREDSVWFCSQSFRILAATQGSLALMGVRAEIMLWFRETWHLSTLFLHVHWCRLIQRTYPAQI